MIHTAPQLPPSTLTEHVYNQLKQAILHGQIAPGERVVAQQIADHFGTSLTPVRESLQKLAKDGLILFRPHRGAVAVVPKRADFEQLFQVRAALERLATHEAQPHMTEADFETLQITLETGDACVTGKRDPDHWLAADQQFHDTIVARSGNTLLHEMLLGLRDRIRLHRETYFTSPELIRQSVAEHRAVVEALRHGSPDAAADRMNAHLTSYLNTPGTTPAR